MSFAPLFASPGPVVLHAIAALAAFALGLVQIVAPKGTVPHRLLGWLWVAIMAFVALSSFFVHEIRLWGPWSPIHLLSIGTLFGLAAGVYAARRHAVRSHRNAMIGIFVGGLVIAGGFTLLPGRIMHAVVFGG